MAIKKEPKEPLVRCSGAMNESQVVKDLNFYYSPDSPSCIRWNREVWSGKNNSLLKIRVGDVAGSLDKSTGYYRTNLALVHRLIWEMHFGTIPDGMVINHIDGNKTNNLINNLEMTTQKKNCHNCKSKVNNKSGVNGVHKTVDRVGTPYWVAFWRDSGKNKSKSFSVNKFGDVLAFEMAVEYRNIQIELLNKVGENYTDRHGK